MGVVDARVEDRDRDATAIEFEILDRRRADIGHGLAQVELCVLHRSHLAHPRDEGELTQACCIDAHGDGIVRNLYTAEFTCAETGEALRHGGLLCAHGFALAHSGGLHRRRERARNRTAREIHARSRQQRRLRLRDRRLVECHPDIDLPFRGTQPRFDDAGCRGALRYAHQLGRRCCRIVGGSCVPDLGLTTQKYDRGQ